MPAPYKTFHHRAPDQAEEAEELPGSRAPMIDSERGPQIRSAPSAQVHLRANCGSLANRAQSPLRRRNLRAN
jgi:hypothetical protein